jgi:hypothetical protein
MKKTIRNTIDVKRRAFRALAEIIKDMVCTYRGNRTGKEERKREKDED